MLILIYSISFVLGLINFLFYKRIFRALGSLHLNHSSKFFNTLRKVRSKYYKDDIQHWAPINIHLSDNAFIDGVRAVLLTDHMLLVIYSNLIIQ